MSSTYKTANLGLNQFVGSDRPKMEDFNFDNQTIDTKFQEHIQSNLHLTEAQREQLGKASYTVGSYSGNGQAQRTVEVEGEIGFLIVFAADEPFNQTVTSTGDTYVYAAVATSQGSSKGVSIVEGGFSVTQATTSPMDGKRSVLNQAGKTYLYVAFPPAA